MYVVENLVANTKTWPFCEKKPRCVYFVILHIPIVSKHPYACYCHSMIF